MAVFTEPKIVAHAYLRFSPHRYYPGYPPQCHGEVQVDQDICLVPTVTNEQTPTRSLKYFYSDGFLFSTCSDFCCGSGKKAGTVTSLVRDVCKDGNYEHKKRQN
jgi:hypothetical protein